jgi:flagellar basal body rod protein FlgG
LTPSLRLPVESAIIEITTDGLFWVTDIKDLEKPDDNRMMIGNIQLVVPADCSFTLCGDGVFLIRWNGKHHTAWIGNPGIDGRGELRQACLEGSNVDPQEELEKQQKLHRQTKALEEAVRPPHPATEPAAESPDLPVQLRPVR